MNILLILEATTNMLEIDERDFNQIKAFFDYLAKNKSGYDLSISDIMRFVLTIKSKKSALAVAAGAKKEVTRSLASSNLGREANIARAFSDEKDIRLGDMSLDAIQAIGEALNHAKFATLDWKDPEKSTIDKDATARLLKFSNVIRSKFKTPKEVSDNFNTAKMMYYQTLGKFAGMVGVDDREKESVKATLKEVTPNVLLFLANIAKKKGRSAAWDTVINPENYGAKDLEYAPISYNPKQAAEELIALGWATKTPAKNMLTLNKEAIFEAVSRFRDQLENLKKGTIEHPSNVSRNLKSLEQNAKELIQKMDQFSNNEIKRMAEDLLVKALQRASQETGDSTYIKAYKFYQSKLEDAKNSEEVGSSADKIQKSHLGTIFRFLRARIIARMMYYYASQVLGDRKKWKTPTKDYGFLTLKELSMVKTAFTSGQALKRSRIA